MLPNCLLYLHLGDLGRQGEGPELQKHLFYLHLGEEGRADKKSAHTQSIYFTVQNERDQNVPVTKSRSPSLSDTGLTST